MAEIRRKTLLEEQSAYAANSIMYTIPEGREDSSDTQWGTEAQKQVNLLLEAQQDRRPKDGTFSEDALVEGLQDLAAAGRSRIQQEVIPSDTLCLSLRNVAVAQESEVDSLKELSRGRCDLHARRKMVVAHIKMLLSALDEIRNDAENAPIGRQRPAWEWHIQALRNQLVSLRRSAQRAPVSMSQDGQSRLLDKYAIQVSALSDDLEALINLMCQ
jgi:hypothetical protein